MALTCHVRMFVKNVDLQLRCSLLTRSASFFRRSKTDPENDPDVQLPDSLSGRRSHKSGSDLPTMKDNLNLLNTHRSLTTKKGYQPSPDVADRVERITRQITDVPQGDDWTQVNIVDGRLKYKLLTRLMEEFDHSVPNTSLNEMKTVKDAVDFFATGVQTTHSLEDLSKLDLPKNLHIQMDYLRFDPENDKMFNGKTAFPGRDTVVKSIKYKRKYTNIKTKEEKPGYANHYYGY